MKYICKECGNIEGDLSEKNPVVAWIIYFAIGGGIGLLVASIVQSFVAFCIVAPIALVIANIILDPIINPTSTCSNCKKKSMVQLDSKEGIDTYNKFNKTNSN